MTTAARRTFTMHPNLLWDVITRQAGSLGKAVLEAAMNSIDAGASKCEISLTQTKLSIVDDGRGFRDEDEIVRFFETFGYPHDAGDATYGRFRMGRGQIFSFGANLWTSNAFRMRVDLKPQRVAPKDAGAIGYDFEKTAESVPGCRIDVTLYERLLPSAIDAAVREVREHVAWAQIPIILNGVVINKAPSEGKWTMETDDAYLLLNEKGSLDVYNLGVLVCRMPAHRYGTGGVVVSKTVLDVNFARNDIQSSCPIWKRIVKHLAATTKKTTQKKARLSDAERSNLAFRLKTGEMSLAEAGKLSLVTDVSGNHHAMEKLPGLLRGKANSVSVAERGDRIAERAMSAKLAFVMSKETLDRFDVPDAKALIESFAKFAAIPANWQRENYWISDFRHLLARCVVIPAENFLRTFSDTHETIPDKELIAGEKLALRVIEEGATSLRYAMARSARLTTGGFGYALPARTIRVGRSDVADAWTDGSKNVWINRKKLPLVRKGHVGLIRIAALLLHEFMHSEDDVSSHVHDADFYSKFHDAAIDSDILGKVAGDMLLKINKELRLSGKAPGGSLAASENRIASFAALVGDSENEDVPEELFVEEDECIDA
jgi:hypothetical protein